MSQPQKETSSLLKGTSIVATLNLLSRLLGFVRDLLSASAIGASALSDCFYVAFRIPNLLRSILAEGALTSGFIPVMSEATAESKEAAQRLFSACLLIFGISTLILTILGIIFSKEIIHFIAPGFTSNQDQIQLAAILLAIMFPYIISICFLSLINGALNTFRIFGAAAWGQIVVNICLILGAALALFYNRYTATIILAASFMAGGVFQVLYQLRALKQIGLRFSFYVDRFPKKTWQVLRLMLPAVFGAAIYQVSAVLATMLASVLPEGSVSWLYYADRLSQLPIGIFTIALGSVLLPTLASASANSDQARFQSNLENSLRYTNFIIPPLAMLLFCYSDELISFLFERGAFSAHDTRMSGIALQATALGIWSISVVSMLNRALIAKKDTLTPTLLGLTSLCVTLVLSLILMGPIPVSTHSLTEALRTTQETLATTITLQTFGHAGLAFAAGASALILVPVYAAILGHRKWFTSWMPIIISASRSILVSIVIACLIIPTLKGCCDSAIMKLILAGIIVPPAYLLLQWACRAREFYETRDTLFRLARKFKLRA